MTPPTRASSPRSEAIARARTLRRRETDAEKALWEHLRGRRLDGLKFRRQHPIGPWAVDFVCLQPPIVIEVDGGVHRQHQQAERDRNRDATLETMGFRVVRIANEQVLDDVDTVLRRIAEVAADTPRRVDTDDGNVKGALTP